MSKYSYADAFALEGCHVSGRNVPWGVIGPNGILRWMGHANHFRWRNGLVYEDTGLQPAPYLTRKVQILTDYCAAGHSAIRIMHGVFKNDGKNKDGVYESASLDHATETVYVGVIETWDPEAGIFICKIHTKEGQ